MGNPGLPVPRHITHTPSLVGHHRPFDNDVFVMVTRFVLKLLQRTYATLLPTATKGKRERLGQGSIQSLEPLW